MTHNKESYDWTDARVERLKALWAAGATASQIAMQLGGDLSRNAVIGKKNRLGLTRRRDSSFKKPEPERPRPERKRRRARKVFAPQPAAAAHGPEIHDTEIDTVTLHEIERSAPPDTFLGIPLLKLDQEHCRYPRGAGLDILFCGQPKKRDSSYCTACHRRCHGGFHKMILSDLERDRRARQALKNSRKRMESRAA